MVPRLRPFVADAASVLAFVAIGRTAHAEGNPLVGLVLTAMPFLVAAAVAHLMLLHRGSDPLSPAAGILVWLVTVAGGMLGRALVGEGTAWAFVLVALAFLGVLVNGWRFAVRLSGWRSVGAAAGAGDSGMVPGPRDRR